MTYLKKQFPMSSPCPALVFSSVTFTLNWHITYAFFHLFIFFPHDNVISVGAWVWFSLLIHLFQLDSVGHLKAFNIFLINLKLIREWINGVHRKVKLIISSNFFNYSLHALYCVNCFFLPWCDSFQHNLSPLTFYSLFTSSFSF